MQIITQVITQGQTTCRK